jgi:hypothetical protein
MGGELICIKGYYQKINAIIFAKTGRRCTNIHLFLEFR